MGISVLVSKRIVQLWIFHVNDASDEILLSSDKTIAIIDGSGVLHDPVGINRAELIKLAKARLPVGHFDVSKLSENGYLVKVEQQDVKLPCEFVWCPMGSIHA